MRKKWLGISLSVGITGALIWGYGASASADSTTMGVYESALHQTKEAKNMTAHAQLTLTDNGAKLLTLEGVAKIDHNQHIGNVDATFTDTLGEKSMQAFLEKDQVVVKKGDSNVYRVMEKMDRGHQSENDVDNNRGAMMHKLFATVFGDLGKNATVENLPDGGKRTSLQLSEEQIPAFIQVAGPIIYDKLAEHSQEASSSENHLSVQLPRLQIQVDQVLLNAKIDEKNQIEQQSAVVYLSGTDASGKEHKLQLSLDIRLSDLGTTTPDRIDLTGKQVEKVSREDMKNKWRTGWTKHSDSE
ncbi:hypothetical protein [Brevibacillus sp. DP1.3A]|uniref:hypothetical protein n=1 Tax=Brevibacillus sp. DP1.3A TaxID=2738867 RepID=UPI00156A79BF|nr:hypothetical protein [Brevibacillus sp. DP1.3A]UED76267.1 hypothetical protein HP399_007175 [Brevibacillus sp. DP1.3A]